MQNITKWPVAQVGHTLVLLSFLTLALLGQLPDSQAGWVTCPPRLAGFPVTGIGRRRLVSGPLLRARLRCCWHYLRHSWRGPLARSLLWAGLWLGSGRQGPGWLVLVPLLGWLWQATGVGWPRWRRHPGWRAGAWGLWQGQRWLLLGYLGLALTAPGAPWCAFVPGPPRQGPLSLFPLGLGCTPGGQETPWVEVTRREDGRYRAELCGHFTLELPDDDLFRRRMLLLFLRQLQVPGDHRGSRRTRDGRTPFVRQVQLQEWFGLPHPDISRLERDWLRGDWTNLLSQRLPEEVLTAELRDRIVTVCATLLPHNSQEVYQHLQQQGVQVSHRQVRQAWEQSGWSKLHQELQRRYRWTPATFQLRDEFLVQELLRQNQLLLECLETGQAPPPEEQVALADLRALARQLGSAPPPPVPARPWLLRVQRVLFGSWELVTDDTIRCPQCGSAQVGRKSRQGRRKKFYDAEGGVQEVVVYRYYCRNPHCSCKTFTHLPPGLVPYSRHRLEVHTLALQAYEWSASRYRRVGPALGVSAVTVYRWVSAWGQQLLPVAALFGLVRSSGVVGVDEKYVLVPKNDKLAGKMRRWMSTWPLTSTPMICCTSRSIRTTARKVRRPFCWPCGPRAITRRWSSPICGGTMGRSSPRSLPRPATTSASFTPSRQSATTSRTSGDGATPQPTPRRSP